MAWTTEQQKVIDTRNKNLLVSAAAGSGKTAVLVERIISMISEGDNPIDIDRLLVVTFTNAAAAEMRGRVGKALEEKLRKEPDNLHLQKQVSLLQSSHITTIHSFCLNVIRNYFHSIDLDPSFKIAEESEITLMKSDVMQEILERWYEEGREDFHAFIESYSYSKSDTPIEELILQLYHFSMSDPWPKQWLRLKQKSFEIDTLDKLNDTKWMSELLYYVKAVIEDLLHKNQEAMDICNENSGPSAYITALVSDRDILQKLRQASSYEEYEALLASLSFARLSAKKEEGVDPSKKEEVKVLREEIKKGLKDITNQFFFQSSEEMMKDIQAVQKVMQVLFELSIEFMDEFSIKKEEKNLIDFNDLEHFALRILVEEKEGVKQPSLAAQELSEHFIEILIDEYQDSNMVQETILQSISRERLGNPNRFMVGDVKQSIYKFRLAMPEIFMEKYKMYSLYPVLEQGEINLFQRIDLDRNFRSRKVVLHCVNHIFEQIMMEPVGGIVYDEAAALKYGELYEDSGASNLNIAKDVELLLVTDDEVPKHLQEDTKWQERAEDSKGLGTEEDPEEIAYTKKEMEARAIAIRIKELTDPCTGLMLYDNKAGQHRLATYRDIVILLRSMSNGSEIILNTLLQEGIPAYADTSSGYFQTIEIMTVLNMLRIIDNPRQDIPFVGVLYSPIVGLTTEELSLIRGCSRKTSMYGAVLQYLKDVVTNVDDDKAADNKAADNKAADNKELNKVLSNDRVFDRIALENMVEYDEDMVEDDIHYVTLQDKLHSFLTMLKAFRASVEHTPIHELIQSVLEQTGYYYYVMAMSGGDRRKANIDMLVAQAVQFERGSYSGLFHFIRYMEKLHKYEVDFGEAATAGEQDNTVRIMSIHKSKGLQFPIVFVGGMSKQFNTQDLRSSIILHSDLGVGPEYIDATLRTKVPTLFKKVIQKKVQIENLGEELRVLYVALTRAQEKLIMTGYLKTWEDIKCKKFSFYEILSAKSYQDWVLPAMVNRITGTLQKEAYFYSLGSDGMVIKVLPKEKLLKEEIMKQIFLGKEEEALFAMNSETLYNEDIRNEINSRLQYQYPYEGEATLPMKMTVTELKKLGLFAEEDQSEMLYPDKSLVINQPTSKEDSFVELTIEEPEFNPTLPNFISPNEEVVTGSDRGTLYHKVLELLDLTKIETTNNIEEELQKYVRLNRIKESEIKKIKIDAIDQFIHSDVARRMRKAQLAGKLYKEKQFVFGIKAKEIYKESNSEELILVQGIIDVFFEEEDGIVLLDYKSDMVKEEGVLVRRYKIQLEYYRKALEQMLQKKVKEMILYSLYHGKEIRID